MMEPSSAIAKAFDVLFHLHEADRPLGVSDVARALGLPKSSAHRLLGELASRGMVDRDANGAYRPGVALVTLGQGVLRREPVVEAARPVLVATARRTGETAFLTAARSGRIVVLDKVEGASLLRVSPTVGSEVPVHATAVGKLQLAFAPADVPEPAGRLEAFTAQTPTSARRLAEEVERARNRGWAENREEWIEGLAVVAAPVFDGERLEACVVVAAPATRFRASRTRELSAVVVEAAGEVARRLAPWRSVA